MRILRPGWPRLGDAPRCGAPAMFTPEVICRIMALACADPDTLDVPISHWSQSELARQAVRRASSGYARPAIVPLLLVVATATLAARTIEPRSIYDARLTDAQVRARQRARDQAGETVVS